MNDLLFNIPETKSPRLLWMERHGFLTHYHAHEEPGSEWMCIIPMAEDKGLHIAECMARHCRIYDEGEKIGYGSTEADSITDCAVKHGIPLWNEEERV